MTNDASNPGSPECRQFDEALQRYLDGGEFDLSPELLAHRTACPACSSQFQAAVLLRSAIKRVPAPMPSATWTNVTMAAMLTDESPSLHRPPIGLRVIAWVSIAAALLVAVAIIRPWSLDRFNGRSLAVRTPVSQPPPPILDESHSDSPVYLDKGLSEARSIVAEVTRRTADSAVEPTRNLLPAESPPSPLAVRDSLPRAVEPATESLEDIRHGAASGLEPMANSARRAFSMFMKEVPTLAPERKPDS
ncbi:MAG TPA: hypothetical protein VGZ47_21375 [Gemmataceae bacterium]|jgi:hypothetical protein|nr:hypothetical protein [Gemmataceae bacterium]